jgi:hypothetical protein
MYKTFVNLSFIAFLLSLAGCNAFPSYYPPQQNPNAPSVYPPGSNNPNAGLPPVIVNSPPAPVYTAPLPKYGPGSGNNMLTPSSGYLDIRTNSANGKLTLRVNPDQNAQGLIEIPNGTSGIYYSNRFQVGDYVWYNATYGSSTGWLRGDYLNAY